MQINDVQYMIQGNFDGMVDYAASHDMPIPESIGKVGDKLVVRLEDKEGNRFKATLDISLEVDE